MHLLEEVRIAHCDGRLSCDGGEQTQVILVVGMCLLIVLHADDAQGFVAGHHRRAQPGVYLRTDGFNAQFLHVLLHSIRQQQWSLVCQDVFGQPPPIPARRPILPLAMLYSKGEGDLFCFFIVEGDEKIGRVHHLAYLGVDRIQDCFQIERGADGPASLIQDG